MTKWSKWRYWWHQNSMFSRSCIRQSWPWGSYVTSSVFLIGLPKCASRDSEWYCLGGEIKHMSSHLSFISPVNLWVSCVGCSWALTCLLLNHHVSQQPDKGRLRYSLAWLYWSSLTFCPWVSHTPPQKAGRKSLLLSPKHSLELWGT